MCDSIRLENEFHPRIFLACGVPLVENDAIREQLLDFLDGRTHGEDLLHGLYDYVLGEPVPERMRALFRPAAAPTQG